MSKHTEGPWIIKQPGEHRAKAIVVVASHGLSIHGEEYFAGVAEICVKRSALEMKTGTPSTEEQANARLIAAAPRLLEALKNYVEAFECDFVDAGIVLEEPEWKPAVEHYKKARAAIAEAGGEA